ncbi:MAG: hypothetical protein HWN70_13290 [Desulfobacterales bacterium]|nr:hypothetical protein [Desulfobacterales bacterium]
MERQKALKVKKNYLSAHQKEKGVKTDFIDLSVVFSKGSITVLKFSGFSLTFVRV